MLHCDEGWGQTREEFILFVVYFRHCGREKSGHAGDGILLRFTRALKAFTRGLDDCFNPAFHLSEPFAHSFELWSVVLIVMVVLGGGDVFFFALRQVVQCLAVGVVMLVVGRLVVRSLDVGAVLLFVLFVCSYFRFLWCDRFVCSFFFLSLV